MLKRKLERITHMVTWPLVKKSANWSMVISGGVSTVMTVVGVSLVDLLPQDWGWPLRLLFLAVIFVAIAVVAAFATCRRSGSGVHATICNTDVEVKVGDLFSFDGIKVIPFDEYFDTEVDDKVISRNSLNGIFLERKVGHRDLILRTIAEPQQSILGGPEDAGGRLRYRLGTVKAFEDYALLAFTHMDEFNRAHLERGQYEECLLNMWDELDCMYAGRRVVLPLLGSGITRFKGTQPSEDDLLRCMLCTLRASGHRFSAGVSIALTKKTADKMRLYEVKDYTDAWRQGMGEKIGL